ncbi:type II secretion system protein J [Ornithinibacillus sp. 179-J 7C1 HS]|uniref:PulJ/GspJ family protein n=1 Tax=Ornithinibacillus sp. 179-J 7C1 HS TaxID=3142384 RepID=UPI0039A06849
MLFRQLKNEKGLTLVELLATISLFTIIIALSTALIFQLFQNEETSSERINLVQETNVLVNQLKNDYLKESDTLSQYTRFNLCLSQPNDIQISKFVINENESLQIVNGCIKEVIAQETLPITITTTNRSGYEITVKTTWKSIKNPPPIVLTDEPEEEVPSEFNEVDKIVSCIYDGNTKFTVRQIGSWQCPKISINNGSTLFSNNNLSIHDVEFMIDNNLYADKAFRLDNSTEINVGKNAFIEQNLSLYWNTSINVQRNFTSLAETLLHNNSNINIGGDAKFNNLKLYSTSAVVVNGDASFNGPVRIENQANIIIKGNATFYMPVDFNSSSGKICTEGNAIFHSTVSSPNNIIIKNGTGSCDL